MRVCMVHSEPSRLPRILLERDSLTNAGYDAYILEPTIGWRFRPRIISAAARYSALMMQELMQHPDAYHVMNIPDILALIPVLKRTRFVYDVRSPWGEELKAFGGSATISRAAERTEKYLSERADIVIAVNNVLAERARQWGAKRVFVLPNYPPRSFSPTVDPRQFKSMAGLCGKRIILFVGKFSSVECTIDIVKMLDKIVKLVPDAVLVMIGDGPQRQEIEQFVDDHGLRSNIAIPGWINYSEVPNWISIADVCLLPRREDMPSARFYSPHSVRKVGEYLSQRKPVIATPVGEFKNTELPIIVAPLADFPEAISEALRFPPQVSSPNDFTWESTEHVLLEAYEELEHMA